jgi:anti-sigma factor ChrR (cupin superfamily)
VQRWAVGRPLGELESCMGVPDRADRQAGMAIAQWRVARPSGTTTLPLADLALLPIAWPISLAAAGSVSTPQSGDCDIIATAGADGRVTQLNYAGDRDGWRGRNSVCLPRIDGCLR